MVSKPYIVGIGGTTRANSSTEKAVRYALKAAEELGATTRHFTGPELAKLPLYAPELPDRVPEAVELIEEIRKADGLIIGSPGYHGSVSGLVKNALDYTEDMREDEHPYATGRPIGLIATGAGWQGVVTTLDHLRTIAHTLRGWPTPLGAAINSTLPTFDEQGDVTDEKVAFQLRTVAEEVLHFVGTRVGV
jgi:FMN reductase